jgi:hypothetical protein
VDDRTHIAAMALQGIASNPNASTHFDSPEEAAEFAIRFADALIAELAKVPAPSGGPVAPPPGSDSPDSTAQEVNKGAAT